MLMDDDAVLERCPITDSRGHHHGEAGIGQGLLGAPPAADQMHCESDDFATRSRRTAAISVVLAALIVLAAIVCAIYVQ
jgi:hypothetical protein